MLTLLEAAKLSRDPIQSAVIQMFAESSDILNALGFSDIPGGGMLYNQEETLPGIGFRGVNEAYDESVGVVNPVFDPLVIAGGDLDVDNFILKTRGEDVRAVHEKMKVKALTLKITQAFLKGDQVSEPRSFDGLQTRLTGSQVIANGSTSGGDVISLAKLDELIDAVDNPTHLIMNKTIRRNLTQGARDTSIGGFITYGVDAFGRQVTKYNDLPILIADQDNQGNDILPFTEAAASGTSQCTSVYCVSLMEGYLEGIQSGIMDVRDLGELQEKPAKRTRVEWFMGIALQHRRAAARLKFIKAGKAAA
jgi:hypothetical protein